MRQTEKRAKRQVSPLFPSGSSFGLRTYAEVFFLLRDVLWSFLKVPPHFNFKTLPLFGFIIFPFNYSLCRAGFGPPAGSRDRSRISIPPPQTLSLVGGLGSNRSPDLEACFFFSVGKFSSRPCRPKGVSRSVVEMRTRSLSPPFLIFKPTSLGFRPVARPPTSVFLQRFIVMSATRSST